MHNSRLRPLHDERGFTLTELLGATMIMLIVTGSALATFQNAIHINDSAAQLADANQNLRAGVNQMIKDIMQAGRIIGPEGIPVPTGGATAINRPTPPGMNQLTFDLTTTTNLPDITTGYQLGPTVNNKATDLITIMTVDAFMPTIETPPTGGTDPNEGVIDPSGASVTLPANSLWLTGDLANDTPAIEVGDLILFKNPRGMAVQTVTGKDATHLYFDPSDWFGFNQRNATAGTVIQIKNVQDTTTAWGGSDKTTLFRAVMTTYYVDSVTTPGSPRLVRQINHKTPQALAGVVEDLELTYDLVDGINNPSQQTSLPTVIGGLTYTSNQIRTVNVHAGVRSEAISHPTADYIRNHISTSVDVRSLASVDRYVAQ